MRYLFAALSILLIDQARAQDALTVWTHYVEVQELEWLQQQAAAYEETTGTRIDIVEVPFDDIRQKLSLGASEGEAADLIVTIPHDWLGEIAEAGVIEPLDSFVAAEELEDLEPVAVDAFSYQGRLFGLPMFMEGIALLYNRDLVAEAPETWEEFLELAKQHTTGSTFGFLYQPDIPYYGYGFWKAFGGYIFGESEDGSLNVSDIGLGGEAGYAAAQTIKDLRYTHNLIPEGVDYQVANSAFVDGVLAMILNGPWAVGDYRDAGLDFGIAPLPAPTGASEAWGPMVGVQGIVLNAYSDQHDEAMAFAKYLVAPEQQVSFNQAGGRIPASLSAIEALADDPTVQGFSASIALGDPMPNVPEMSRVWEAWGNTLELALQSPDSDVQSLIDQMMAQLTSN